MVFKKMWIPVIILLSVLYGVASGDEYNEHLDKNMSLSIKLGTHIYPDSDFIDYWDFDPETIFIPPIEMAYEYKLKKNIGIEISGGYTQMDSTVTYLTGASPSDGTRLSSEVSLANIYILTTIKLYKEINDSFLVYGGIGPNVYDSMGQIKCQVSGGDPYKLDISRFSFGAHGVAGVEYYFFKAPTKHGLYDWPVSAELQYRYTWNNLDKIDRELINQINTDYNTQLENNDAAVGGHSFTIAIKWHL